MIVTLTTDFGDRDPFVGMMKGVILGINPGITVVDLAHHLPAHNVARAAFAIYTSHTFFPPGTIHVVVVDPGVGSSRKILALKARQHMFIAPDNGLLSYILEGADAFEARQIENSALMRPEVSRTFHGRDIMAPAAARLSLGFAFEDVGPAVDRPVRLPRFEADIGTSVINGRVVYVDRFGNLITNIPNQAVFNPSRPGISIIAGPVVIQNLSPSYADAAPGEYLALPGSGGFLEIARNTDRAEQPSRLTVGTEVIVRLEPEKERIE